MSDHMPALASKYPIYGEIWRRFKLGQSLDEIAWALQDEPKYIEYRLQQMGLEEPQPPPKPRNAGHWDVWHKLVPRHIARKQQQYEFHRRCLRAYNAGMSVEDMAAWLQISEDWVATILRIAKQDKRPPVKEFLARKKRVVFEGKERRI